MSVHGCGDRKGEKLEVNYEGFFPGRKSGRPMNLVVFTLDEQPYALYLSIVERVFRIVEVTPLPKAPEIVLGLINVQGQIIPVLDIRKRFRLPERDMSLGDQLILAHTARRTVALVVDAVKGVVECAEEGILPAEEILPNLEYVAGVAKLEDGLIFIHDLDEFLSLEESNALDAALKAGLRGRA